MRNEYFYKFCLAIFIISCFASAIGGIFFLIFEFPMFYVGQLVGGVVGILFVLFIYPFRIFFKVREEAKFNKQSYLICPRCNIPVEKNPGICPECGKQL